MHSLIKRLIQIRVGQGSLFCDTTRPDPKITAKFDMDRPYEGDKKCKWGGLKLAIFDRKTRKRYKIDA